MFEKKWHWTTLGIQKRLTVRLNWYGLRSIVRNAAKWLAGTANWYTRHNRPVKVELRSTPCNQDVCYCPTGSTTDFRFSFFGATIWLWLSRDWTIRPCHCDKVIWCVFPDNYQDEIEDYGHKKLAQEYPEFKAALAGEGDAED